MPEPAKKSTTISPGSVKVSMKGRIAATGTFVRYAWQLYTASVRGAVMVSGMCDRSIFIRFSANQN
ncbi:MAG TPA: hypothetical protein VGG11_18910 [Xanthobacteraceae bacterium]